MSTLTDLIHGKGVHIDPLAAVDDLPWELAGRRVLHIPNTIWKLLGHLNYWMDYGLKSIEGALRSQDYARLRIGVGPLPPEYDDMADFVLERFEADEARVIAELLDPMTEAVECWVTDGIETAMNRHNRNPKPTEP